jgi:hypothetical protein
MSTPKEGGASANIVPISLRRAPEQGRFHGVKTPEAMRQQRADTELEAYRRLLKEPRGSAVFENPIRVPRPSWPKNPGERRGQPESSKSSPAEQQAAERLGKPPPQEPVEETLDPEVEEAIRAYAMGDPEEEAQLREQVKNDPDLRHAFLHPGGGLAYGPHPPKKD